MLLIFLLLLYAVYSQRTIIWSSPMNNETDIDSWDVVHGSIIYDIINCPSGTYCFSLSNYADTWRYDNTEGYSSIEISFKVKSMGLEYYDYCEIWYIVDEESDGEEGWINIFKEQPGSNTMIGEIGLPSEADNNPVVGIDLFIEGSFSYCYFNDIELSGIPINDTSDDVLIGGIVGAIIILLICVVLGFIIYKRKLKKTAEDRENDQDAKKNKNDKNSHPMQINAPMTRINVSDTMGQIVDDENDDDRQAEEMYINENQQTSIGNDKDRQEGEITHVEKTPTTGDIGMV